MSEPRARLAIIGAICALGLALRLAGLQYGLPAVYNPDEVAIMARALSFAKGTLNPHNFLYPTFYFYVLFAWVGVYLAFVWLTGRVASLDQLQKLYFTNPTGIYTAGRTLGVAAGTASIAALYRLGASPSRQPRSRGGGALSGGCTAPRARFALRQARRSGDADDHRGVSDDGQDLAGAAYVVTENARHVAAAAACGVAFSTHYYTVFLAVALLWTLVQGWKARGWLDVRSTDGDRGDRERDRVLRAVAVHRARSR